MTLTFKLAGGAINKSFTAGMEKTADIVLDPATLVVGLSGAGVEAGWGDPTGSCKAECTKSDVKDAKTKAGSYEYTIATVNIPVGALKIRFNGAWYGTKDAVEVTGLEYDDLETDGDHNFQVTKPGAYKVVFNAEWDGEALTSFKVAFTRLGDLLLDPSTFKVGVSGNMWKDGTTEYGWNDPFDKDGVCTVATFKSKNVTNATTLAGTYVFEIASLPIVDGGEFKLRDGGDWIGASGCTIEGLNVTGDDNMVEP